MIQLKQITLSRGIRKLLDQVELTLHAGYKVGLIGANGSGKTSLLMLLLNRLHADEGEVTISKNSQLAHLKQEVPQIDLSALDYVLQGDQVYTDLQQQLCQAEAKHDGVLIAELHMQLAEIDGYAAPAKAAKILHGLGFTTVEINQPIKAFSGGWQMRLNLAQLLMTRAEILLLDEPTNHLDLEAIVWLEKWLSACTQTILLISHDREFLDNMVTHIAHLHQQQIKLYTGNYSSFEIQRATQLAMQQAAYEKQQAAREHLQSFIDRFRYKATKARQAQSRIKMLERMENILPAHTDSPFRFAFKPTQDAGSPILTFDNISLGYGDNTILSKISFSVRDSDRIGLIGPNGAGKSTLIKFLAGETEKKSGVFHCSNKVKIGYFSQHQLEVLDAESSALQHLQDLDRSISESIARKYLGGFAFSNDDVFRPIGSFSGGEKARLVLALIIWQTPNLLLLDEPTNHLDLEMREALNMALQDYQGALIIVSHDRYLLSCVANELWLVADQKVQPFDGDLNDYQRWFAEREKPTVDAKKSKATPSRPVPQATIQKLEKEHEQKTEKLKAVDIQLSDSTLYSADQQKNLNKLLSQRDKLLEEIKRLEEKLLEAYS